MADRRCTSCIDQTDGTAASVHQICKASGVGMRLFGEALPLHPLLPKVAKLLDIAPLTLLFALGADFQLLGTTDASLDSIPLPADVQRANGGSRVYTIGEVVSGAVGCSVNLGAKEYIIPDHGLRHFHGTIQEQLERLLRTELKER